MKRCNIGLFFSTAALFVVHLSLESNGISIEIIHQMMYSSLVLLNLFTITSILRYGKREIVTLTSAPNTKRTLFEIIRALGKHVLDIIMVPALTLYMVFDAFMLSNLVMDYYYLATISFTLLTLTQMAPLKYQKDKYARQAHLRINGSVKVITISRNMIEGIDRRSKKYKGYMNEIMHSEEVIRCDSEFLMLSGGKFVMLVTSLRVLSPALPTIIQLVIP
jgi:hypothetical protein